MKTTQSPSRESELQEEEIRVRAYFLWLERGCLHGEDCAHWFAARQQLLAERGSTADHRSEHAPDRSSHFAIEKTLGAHLSDPTHRFHAPGTAHDARLDVVAGEARQRVRGRHFDSSLRPRPKKPR